MRPISDIFLVEAPVIATGETYDPRSVKTTPALQRVDSDELELSYINNPTIFNGINKIVQTIMAASHKVEAKDRKVQAFFDEFIGRLGLSGSDITWEELLAVIYQHQCIYGAAFVENIFNKRHNRIVDWDAIDPKKMDYAKDVNKKIVLDNLGKPVGYFELLPMNEGVSQIEIPNLPPHVAQPMSYRAIFMKPEQVAHFKLFTVGDGFYGIGLIEPIYRTSLRKLNIEEALANAIYRHGFPVIWAQIGDLNHEATPQQIENMLIKLKDISFKQEIATPYYYNLHILESKKAEKLKEHLEYFREQEVTGLGIPKPFATGGAEGATHATLGKQDSLFQLTLRDIARKTCSAVEKYMFAPVCKYEGFKEIPKLVWDITSGDELDKKSKRLLKYAQAGLISPDMKVMDFIKKAEGLDL